MSKLHHLQLAQAVLASLEARHKRPAISEDGLDDLVWSGHIVHGEDKVAVVELKDVGVSAAVHMKLRMLEDLSQMLPTAECGIRMTLLS